MTKSTSSYVNNLDQFDPSAKVISIAIKDEESLLVKDNKVYASSIAGMQRRPILRSIYPERQTLKGVAARKLADTLRTAVPQNIKGSKTQGLCSKIELDCVYYAPSSLVFVFSSKRQLLELIELSDTATSSSSQMRRILGDSLFVKEKTVALYAAIDSSDRQLEARLMKDLGNDVDLSKLYSHSRLDRHKQLYLTELRQDGSYASSNQAFILSGNPADLNAVFNAREGNLQAFLNTIDTISSGSAPANIGKYKSELIALITGFNLAPDVIELRDRIRREKQEKIRIAEQKAERERLAAIQREQEARDARARERARQLAERKEREKKCPYGSLA